MADHNKTKERGLEALQKQFIELTKGGEDDTGVVRPNGIGPWAGDAKEDEKTAWQAHLDTTGEVHTDARLTQHLLYLAKWVAATEEFNTFEVENVPKKVQSAAERMWKATPTEPKIRERKQTIQMLLALPAGLSDKYGGYPEGILWETANAPLEVEQIAKIVCTKFPKSTIKDNPIARIRVDIGKFNNGVFPCQEGQKPASKYPLLGLPERAKKETAEADEVATAATE